MFSKLALQRERGCEREHALHGRLLRSAFVMNGSVLSQLLNALDVCFGAR